eukprot:scaffold260436_cov51-Attheya_sp.AAC.2
MTAEEIGEYTDICRQVLLLLDVPFVDLRETELSGRLLVIQRALGKYMIPSPLATLKHFENLSSKKVDRKSVSRHYREINLPFYRQPTSRVSHHLQIPCILLTSSELLQSFDLPQPGKVNRFLDQYGSNHVVIIEFDYELPAKVVSEVLCDGVKIRGRTYSFLGCSSSGLKKRKCYLWEGTASDAERIRQENGNFAKIKTVSKRIARFSLLLTNAVPTNIKPSNIIVEPDVENEAGANFTDGCGGISPDLAQLLFREAKVGLKRVTDQFVSLPSVFQVRFQGNKGVFAINSRLGSATVAIRPSMTKFSTDRFPHIYVCDYSRPYSFGHLNRQFIMLLSGLGVPDNVFIKLQQEHFDRVQRMTYDHDAALMILEWRNRASELIENKNDRSKGSSFKHLRPLQQRLIAESLKLRILVPESRSLFGVAETPHFCQKTGDRLPGKLRPGECMVRLTMRGREPFSLHDQFVIVSKNPCYLLGDIRVLRAVSAVERPELRELERDLVDCIVFPIEGTRSHSEEIAGSDLDGDQYFVCWDRRLIPPNTRPPYDYPAYENANTVAPKQNAAALVDYFSIQNTVQLTTGRVDSLFRAWANLHGVSCAECERLGQLFSRVVDSAKSGERIFIPDALIIPKGKRPIPKADSRYVWQRMEYVAQAFVDEQQAHQVRTGTLIVNKDLLNGDEVFESEYENTEDDKKENYLLSLVARNHLSMSEFTKFRFVMQHFDGDVDEFLNSELARHVNFGLFSAVERGFAIERYRVPPSFLNNALRCHSQLVGFREKFLTKFSLDADVPWCFYWQSDCTTNSATFPAMLTHAFRHNTDVMLLLQLPDSVVAILCFSRRVVGRSKRERMFTDGGSLNECMDQPLQDFMLVKAFFISGNFGYLEKYSLADLSYKMDLSEDGLQIYRGERGQTFIHLKVVRSGQDTKCKSTRGRAKTQSVISEYDVSSLQVSIDLTRFNRRILAGNRRHPLLRKTPVYGMEMFVFKRKSNFNEQPIRGISYLDILLEDEDNYFQDLIYEGDDAVQEEDTIHDLVPSADDLMAICTKDFFDLDKMLVDPESSFQSFISLLQAAHQRFGLFPCIPRVFSEVLSNLVDTMFLNIFPVLGAATRISAMVDILPLLAELDIQVSIASLQNQCDEDVLPRVFNFVQIVRRWDVWLSLSYTGRCETLLYLLTSGVDTASLDSRLIFIFRNACEQLSVLLSEFKDGSLESRAASSLSRVGNLRLDPSQPVEDVHESDEEHATSTQDETKYRRPTVKNLPTITLFRVQAIPMRVRFAIGEFVCISCEVTRNKSAKVERDRTATNPSSSSDLTTQQYEYEFPPLSSLSGNQEQNTMKASSNEFAHKTGHFCLGRVVRLCEAPFSISIKLVAPSFGLKASPELLLQCLAQRKSIFWQVSMIPANIITHMRIVDALSSFIESSNSRAICPAPEILPYLFAGSLEGSVESTPVFTQEIDLSKELDALNTRQQEAVYNALLHPVSLVHGPPGTGRFIL